MDRQLINAARTGNAAEVQRLLAAGVDPSKENNLSLRAAAKRGRVEAVRLLLENDRVDPNAASPHYKSTNAASPHYKSTNTASPHYKIYIIVYIFNLNLNI